MAQWCMRVLVTTLAVLILHVHGALGICLPNEVQTQVGIETYCGTRCMVGERVNLGIAWTYAVLVSDTITDTVEGSTIIGNVATFPAATLVSYTRVQGGVFLASPIALAVRNRVAMAVAEIKLLRRCITSYGESVELGGLILKQGVYDSEIIESECVSVES